MLGDNIFGRRCPLPPTSLPQHAPCTQVAARLCSPGSALATGDLLLANCLSNCPDAEERGGGGGANHTDTACTATSEWLENNMPVVSSSLSVPFCPYHHPLPSSSPPTAVTVSSPSPAQPTSLAPLFPSSGKSHSRLPLLLQCGCWHRCRYSGFLSGTKRRAQTSFLPPITHHPPLPLPLPLPLLPPPEGGSRDTGSRGLGLLGGTPWSWSWSWSWSTQRKENKPTEFTDPITTCMKPSSPVWSRNCYTHNYV